MDWQAALEKGWKLLKTGKARESVHYFRRSMADNPGEPGTANAYDSAKQGLAQALQMTGRSSQAEKLQSPAGRGDKLFEAIRGAGFILALILGPIVILWAAAPRVAAYLLPEEPFPMTSFDISRGQEKEVHVRFLTEYDISTGGVFVSPATNREVNGAWEGYENRGSRPMDTPAGRYQGREVTFPGESRGLVWAIGKTDLMGKLGGARIHLSAGKDIKPGEYKIWLTGYYVNHEKAKSLTRIGSPSDPADQIVTGDPLSPSETIPRDRVPMPVIVISVSD